MRVWEGFVFFIYLCFYVLAQQLTQFSPYLNCCLSGLYSGCCPWLFLYCTQSVTSAAGHPTLSHAFIMIFMGRFVNLMSNSLCLSQYTLITSTVLSSALLLTLPTRVLGGKSYYRHWRKMTGNEGAMDVVVLAQCLFPICHGHMFLRQLSTSNFLNILAAVSALYRPRLCAVFSVLL